MNSIKHTAPSGAAVEITLSEFQIGFDLMRAVLKAARAGGIGSKMPEKLSDLAGLANKDVKEIAGFIDIIIDILASKEVEDLIYKCFEKCTYNNARITRDTWDKEDARGDFLWVAYIVGFENIRPFVSHLLSGLKTTFPAAKNDSRQ